MTIDRNLLRAVRASLDAALAGVAEEHGLRSLKSCACTFDPRAGCFTFKVEGVVEGGVDRGGALYEQLRRLRPALPTRETEFVYEDERYRIVGANTTLTKVLVRRVRDDKGYQFRVGAVERLGAAAA